MPVCLPASRTVPGEGIGADVAEYVDVAVVAFLETLQGAVLLGAPEELVDRLQQAGVLAARHRPAQAAGVAEVEGHPHVGEVHLVHGQLVGVHQGQVNLPLVDHAQQVDHLHGVGFLELQFGQAGLHLAQHFRVAAALEYQDALADHALRTGWAALAVAMDDLRGDFQIGGGEARLLLALRAGHQAGGGQLGTAGLVQAGEQVVEVVGSLDLELDPQIVSEALDQFVLEAGFAVAVLEVGGRAVAGDHAQYPLLLYPFETGGFVDAAGEQQKDSE
jgi:hypothetical protein